MNAKRMWIGLAVVLVLSVLLEILFVTPHSANFWDSIPGFEVVFGLAGSFVLILIAKGILGPVFQKPMDHYDQGGEDR